MHLNPGAGSRTQQAPAVKQRFYLQSYISEVTLCYTAAEINSLSGECLKQHGPWLYEHSSPLRDVDVYLNSVRLLSEYKGTFLYCEGERTLGQAAQRGCGVSSGDN